MNIKEKADVAAQLVPYRYDLTIAQVTAIQEASKSEIYDMITMAFYFGFYRALDSINMEKQRELKKALSRK